MTGSAGCGECSGAVRVEGALTCSVSGVLVAHAPTWV